MRARIVITGDFTLKEGTRAVYLTDADGDVVAMMIKSEPGDPTTQTICTDDPAPACVCSCGCLCKC